jgi:hypothetical protein
MHILGVGQRIQEIPNQCHDEGVSSRRTFHRAVEERSRGAVESELKGNCRWIEDAVSAEKISDEQAGGRNKEQPYKQGFEVTLKS